MRFRVRGDRRGVHVLDHSLARCRGYPGGRFAHVSYAWATMGRFALIRRTVCALGLHAPATGWCSAGGGVRRIRICRRCLSPLK